jgi:drug/metabolite transporter (DMT)-like permease
MIPLAVVLGLFLAFCFGTSDYLSKRLTGAVGFYRTAVYTLAVSGTLALVLALLFGIPGRFAYSALPVLALISCSTFSAFLLMYRAYQKGLLSVVSPTVNSFPTFSVLFSIFILGITISAGVLLALAGVIVGIILVSTDFAALRSSSARGLTPGVPEAILAAFFFAVGFTAFGYADETIGYLFPILAARLGAAGVGLVVGAALRWELSPIRGRPLLRLLGMGVLEALGIFSFTLALFYTSIASLPVTTTLGGMGVVFTVGYAVVLMKERVGSSYAVGVVVLVASVASLLYLTA